MLKQYHGIYLITKNQITSNTNSLKEIEDSEYISYYIVTLALRFKRLKINKSSKKYYSLPFRENIQSSLRYIISIINIIYAKYNLKDQKIIVYLNKFKDKYINIFLSKYLKKK